MTTAELRPWLKHYPVGVPANINAEAYPNVISVLNETFQKFGDRPAFACMGKTLTFAQMDEYSRQFAAYLHSRGLKPGDKIAIMTPNILQNPIAIFGALRAGMIIVNTNPLYTPREMKHQFNDSGAIAIVIAENFAANLEKIIGETSIKTVIITSIGEMLGLKGKVVNFVIRKVKKMVPKFNLPNLVTVKEAIEYGKKFNIASFSSTPDDVIMLQYTGGTTGVSKGAMLTNRNLVANMMQMRAVMLSGDLVEGQEVALCPLPLYHIYAFTVNCLGLFSIGALNLLVVNPRDLPSVVKEFKKYPVSIVIAVNTLFNALLNNADFRALNFKSLKLANAGGMALQRPVADRWREVTGINIAEGYGMTESSPVATFNPYKEGNRVGTIGMPAPSTDMRIVNDIGEPLPAGEIGEIQIKGPQVMKGYYNRPQATEDTVKDGWLITGDIGVMDEMGYFKIVDRKKDMILVSGFNVYPNEIEDVVAAHPKVLEVAAIGVKDDKSTEKVKLFVVKKDPSLTEAEIIAYCRENLTPYKVPKIVEFRKDLPKSNVGKILRKDLRDAPAV